MHIEHHEGGASMFGRQAEQRSERALMLAMIQQDIPGSTCPRAPIDTMFKRLRAFPTRLAASAAMVRLPSAGAASVPFATRLFAPAMSIW